MKKDEINADVKITPKKPDPKKGDRILEEGIKITGDAADLLRKALAEPKEVTLTRPEALPTDDQALWVAIRNRTTAVNFERYRNFIGRVFCDDGGNEQKRYFRGKSDQLKDVRNFDARLSINSIDSYNVLRFATEIFLIMECGVVIDKTGDPLFGEDEENIRSINFEEADSFEEIKERLQNYLGNTTYLPYLDRILNALIEDWKLEEKTNPYCGGILEFRSTCPSLLELIWSYWLEEGMLVQTMNAIAMRFQNKRGFSDRDPLAELEIDPLRPLNNLLWGYIQNEHNRLTVARRAYEYDHHYGLTIYGKAVPKLRTADSRSKFLEAFHNLLYRTSIFYREDADTTVIADAFPLLKAIREVHLLLAEGAHNQFGDLPWTARVEMLIEKWLLARSETQQFLRGRMMVPYNEPWMGPVDVMKKLQGWNDVTITHFHDLSTFGEQVLLSIRYGDWINTNIEQQAKNWARYWKPEIQSYIHAYRAVTGVDLTTEPVDATPPWVYLKRQEDQKFAGRF
ncbi:hypothetical protein Geob_2224 [Geotalea daltonii FRC-32]|uniref:Uncharacterized protein n=1 Tax=Geotalea daltonii (strain DSM 22248 / JCM 15807 / FRC-32) TaxID=316067 RepID=B9M9K6_GEODF|nr:hypothetical protein [Geotalea daltonii]ACM20578.1 hypothetical protein Geob_2224 [Geotalea daltonii FRC-32]